MSRVYYDHLVVFERIENIIKLSNLSKEEKLELSDVVDEMIHHRALKTVLEYLPEEDHTEFIDKFFEAPFDSNLVEFINLRIDGDIAIHLEKEFQSLEREILNKLNG